MKLKVLGYNEQLKRFRIDNDLQDFKIGRVVSEHKERYTVRTEEGDLDAEITGNMRFTARGREDFPAVGDWVALSVFNPDFAVIHKILPRYSILTRQATGQHGEIQIIATNIDYAFLVQAVDRDFNINRLERYLTICYSASVKPIIVLTKTDLFPQKDVDNIIERINGRIENVPLLAISNETKNGFDTLEEMIEKGKTYCMLGSSGVGKSTLLNNLSGSAVMKTGNISTSTSKGKHVTSHRELILLENGGILIDNPGMREVGIADNATGLETAFDKIFSLGKNCKYRNCSHTNEDGCRVIEAVENGEINESTYKNYMKMEKEKAHFDASVAEKRQKDKEFGKMVKNFKKDLKKRKPY